MNYGVIVDLIIVVLVLGMTYALMSEGIWGAALMFFNILFSSLIAFNFYEPVAKLIADNVSAMSGWADCLALGLLFLITIAVMRITTDSIAPGMVRFPNPVYHAGRVIFAFAGATLAMAFFLVLYQTAPVHRALFGVMDYQAKPPFGQGLDRRFLALMQYTSGYTFAQRGSEILDPEFEDKRVFDRQGRWLIDHEEARPFGKGKVDELKQGGSGGGADAAAGSTASGGLYDASGRGPGIPGGTGGAAVGLAPTN